MSKKKKYENISAKMIEYHNNEVVSFIRKYAGYAVKISNIRCLKYRDELESGKSKYSIYDHRYTIEYLMMNNFVFELLEKEERDSCIELLNSEDDDNDTNQIIGANMLYTLIENKKQQIKEKLNG